MCLRLFVFRYLGLAWVCWSLLKLEDHVRNWFLVLRTMQAVEVLRTYPDLLFQGRIAQTPHRFSCRFFRLQRLPGSGLRYGFLDILGLTV